MSDVTIPGGKIRAFVERIENIDTELQELNEQKKEVFAEAKGEGFDVKILKEIIKLRKQDEEERDERESMLDLYMRAMEQAGPEKVAKAALIGGFPSSDGQPYFGGFETTDGVLPFPGWGPFEGPDSADIDEDTQRRIAAAAIPVPDGVTKGVVHLTDERRFDVPVVIVCPEFTPAEAREWIGAGEVPELAKAKHLEFVDIDSGHWPMFSKPNELARLLAEVAAQD